MDPFSCRQLGDSTTADDKAASGLRRQNLMQSGFPNPAGSLVQHPAPIALRSRSLRRRLPPLACNPCLAPEPLLAGSRRGGFPSRVEGEDLLLTWRQRPWSHWDGAGVG